LHCALSGRAAACLQLCWVRSRALVTALQRASLGRRRPVITIRLTALTLPASSLCIALLQGVVPWTRSHTGLDGAARSCALQRSEPRQVRWETPADRPARLCSLACIAPLLGALPRVYGTTRRAAARACAPLQARRLTEALRSAAQGFSHTNLQLATRLHCTPLDRSPACVHTLKARRRCLSDRITPAARSVSHTRRP
jgi:hypothetical protein